jgi:hypothetical protein
VRGDATLAARLLLRGTGLAGLTAAVGGGVAVVAASRPWYVAVARVEMLGDDQSRPVSGLAGVPGTPWGWIVLAAGILAVAVGLAIAIDRPPPRARPVLWATAGAVAAAAVAALAAPADLTRVAGVGASDLLEVAEELPVGVDVTMWTTTGSGVHLALAAAALVAIGAAAARDT